jgi:hypothetical protein
MQRMIMDGQQVMARASAVRSYRNFGRNPACRREQGISEKGMPAGAACFEFCRFFEGLIRRQMDSRPRAGIHFWNFLKNRQSQDIQKIKASEEL